MLPRVQMVSTLREGSREREPGTALLVPLPCSCSHIFFLNNNLKKGVGDMFIPFAHDPDLGSTVTSFHSRNQNGNGGQASQKSAKGSSEDPALASGKANCILWNGQEPVSVAAFCGKDLAHQCGVCLFRKVSPRCVGPETRQ